MSLNEINSGIRIVTEGPLTLVDPMQAITSGQADSIDASDRVAQVVWHLPVSADGELHGSVVVSAFGGYTEKDGGIQGLAVTLLGPESPTGYEQVMECVRRDLLIEGMAVQRVADGSLMTYEPSSPRFINIAPVTSDECVTQFVVTIVPPPFANGPVSMDSEVAYRASKDVLNVAGRVATLLYPGAGTQTLVIRSEDQIGGNLPANGLELY